ncbi:hypothetical protein [Rhodococcoides kyotonense]|uniref:Lipoprotein n=1 Tax=Rhodococcoides kyotonense TaxID=398843 RepID=A0A239EL73_9NOCA|nr:hypothetical protein [Rhodococcus kyotonensis]SNS45386.1 hypothetical protein SAMN05421642_102447 [Rhodococcus kyotonensis]
MRSTLISVVALSALVALSGCSSSDSGSDSAAGANAEVCAEFATAYNNLVDLTEAGPGSAEGVDKWEADKDAALAEFSASADKASDSVKDSLTTLVAALPADSLELTEPDSESGQALVDNATAVANSCDADGSSIELSEFPLQKFN